MFLTGKLLVPDNNTRLVLVYGFQETASEEETAMFYHKITYETERQNTGNSDRRF